MRLENTTGGASKFWEAEVIGNQTTLRFGKIGTAGQTQVKTYGSAAEAQAAVAKATQKKLADGYSADAFTSAAGGATATSGVTSAATGPKPHAVAGLMVAAKLPLGERQTFAFYLNRILDTFGAFEAAVDAHQNPEPGTRFAFSREIKPEVKAEIAARHASVVSSLHGPYEGSRAPPARRTRRARLRSPSWGLGSRTCSRGRASSRSGRSRSASTRRRIASPRRRRARSRPCRGSRPRGSLRDRESMSRPWTFGSVGIFRARGAES